MYTLAFARNCPLGYLCDGCNALSAQVCGARGDYIRRQQPGALLSALCSLLSAFDNRLMPGVENQRYGDDDLAQHKNWLIRVNIALKSTAIKDGFR
jgi:hypothetical protein